jgi:uncharacterized protein (DUF2267 family)
VLQAVLAALREHVDEAVFQRLAGQLPAEAAVTPTERLAAGPAAGGCRGLIRDVARRLHVGEPDAAFYARVTFEQLNAFCRGTSPARIAPSLPADMRALLSARADDPAHRHRQVLRTLTPALATLNLRGGTVPAAPTPGEALATVDARPRKAARAGGGVQSG